MRRLKNVTLFVADTYNYGGAVASLKKCMEKCEFDDIVFCTNIPLKLKGIRVVEIPELKGKDDYSHFMIKEAYKYINSDFILVVQHDSWILDEEQFDERLYNFDYAGALWLENDGLANGNAGFNWRSKKLMECVAKDDFVNATAPEDVSLCRVYRRYLETNYNLKWADDEMCEAFSFELRQPIQSTFGFHGYFHKPYQKIVVIKRMGAMGDVVMVEPVMKYFHDNGYRVFLDTLPQFKILFGRHYFPVEFLDNTDERIFKNAKFVNLEMSYEATPEQLHLKTYFEFAGIEEKDYLPYLKSPKLSVGFELNKHTKLSEKYCIIHIDNRPQADRNIYGIHWEIIVDILLKLGYTVFQLGKDDTCKISNATKLNCTNEHFLSYVCGGADLMIGVDSGISHICSAHNVPCIIFFGSVNPRYIHPEWSNKIAIHNHDKHVCEKPFCWHSVVGCEGVRCYIDKLKPPCAQFKTSDAVSAIYKILKIK